VFLIEKLKDLKNNEVCNLMCVVAAVYVEMFPVCVIGHVRLRRVNADIIACFT
jgi:hypothetical protein